MAKRTLDRARIVESFVDWMADEEGTFVEREAQALQMANELVRAWLEHELQHMAAQYEDEIIVDEQRYRRHASGEVRYHSLCGAVRIRRDSYRLVGKHNGPTIVPLELDAGLVENATPALAQSVLQSFATMPLRDYEDEMRAAHRIVPSRSTLERISKRTATALHEDLPVIERVVRAEEVIPKGAASVSVGIDRTTIPMAEQLPQLPERWLRKRKTKRRPPPPVRVEYRMGYVATVAINDKLGNTLVSKRIAATADEGPIAMMERLGAELQHVLDQRRRLPIVVVQDGAPELWNLVEEWFESFRIPVEMKLLDRYHLEERLGQVAELVERDQPSRWRLLQTWRSWLDRSDHGIRRVCRDIRARTYKPPPREARNAARDVRDSPFGELGFDPQPTLRISKYSANIVEQHLNYCSNLEDRMTYASARRRGFPVGSGVTEGACKSVIASRMKRSGQRWFEYGASACLQTRTLHLNARLRRCLELLIEQRRNRVVRG